MNRITLGFRDYAVHLFPGFVALISVYLLVQPLRAWVEYNKVAATIFVFVGGYIIGFVLDAIFHDLVLEQVVRKIPWWRDPLLDVWPTGSGETSINATAKRLLEKHLGHDQVENEFSTSLVLCLYSTDG